ncbi:MAG: maleylpyruvate isomerase family mycothiol-dependent enzyme [Acidimicrobiales bacterium]
MSQYAKAHAEGRQRLSGFITGLDDAQLSTMTLACPKWDVRSLMGHVVGVAADMAEGNFPSGDVHEWIQAAVDAREGLNLSELLDEWDEVGPTIDTWLTNMPSMMGDLLIGDLVTHEQDIRGALGLPGAREGATYELAATGYLDALSGRIVGAGLPALLVRPDGTERVLGEGDHGATVTASTFEILRSIGGRRTVAQISALGWEGDPAPYAVIFSNYEYPDQPIVE